MKILIFLFLIGFGYCSNATQDTVLTRQKKHSFQFSIDQYFEVQNYLGSLITYKYHLNKKSAVRFGFGLNYYQSDGHTVDWHGNAYIRLPDEYKRRGIGIYLQYLNNMNATNELYYYYGVGPFFKYSESENDPSSVSYFNNQVSTISRKYVSNILGISIFFGGEYFVVDKVSLIIETHIEGFYQKRKDEENKDGENIKGSLDIFSLDPVVRFGFSFYL